MDTLCRLFYIVNEKIRNKKLPTTITITYEHHLYWGFGGFLGLFTKKSIIAHDKNAINFLKKENLIDITINKLEEYLIKGL
ncbi:MAG: hypothetical protein H7836_08110 [Magnetococcus sp. YQC-3]